MKGGDVDFSLTEIGVFLRVGSNLYIEFYTIDGGIGVNSTNAGASSPINIEFKAETLIHWQCLVKD
tara:strand:+ start:211 stop:408 length:198 start_codon:yes stop_codon:yes gene_type:complete